MKKRIIAFLCVVAVLGGIFLSGCEKKEAGTFVLGLDDSFPPMGFRDVENDEIVGFDIDVAKEVTKRLGLTLKLQPIDWSQNINELNATTIDCIWNGFTINEERAGKVLFSDPYLRNRQVIVVMANSDITELSDLAGKVVAVQAESSAVKALDKNPELKASIKELAEFKDNVTAMMDLEAGISDAVLMDEIVAEYTIKEMNKPFVVLEEALAPEEYGIGFRKEDEELCKKVNDALHEMAEDGTLAKISEDWFGTDITVIGK